MAHTVSFSARRTRLMNRYHARLSTFGRAATGFTSQPEPRTIGSFARGRQLTAGNYQFAGHLIESLESSIWDLDMPSAMFEEKLHGFRWLDDMAAVGDGPARIKAQEWLFGWLDRYGKGKGIGWTPDLTGRRMIRWINHAFFVLSGQESDASNAYFQSLGHQTTFLSKRWQAAEPGLPRFEALTGLIYAGLALTGMDQHVKPAIKALAKECEDHIDLEGGILTRNPEELLEVFTLLIWAASALSEAGQTAHKAHLDAIERIAPTLRALRHSDGGLARFHGGGRGVEGRLDHALAASGVRAMVNTGLSMGYARISAGRTSVIVDASQPPSGAASSEAHASTLAFELSSGRRPLIVNCGSGVTFGDEWRRAGRATPSHSTLGIDGYSSSRLGVGSSASGRDREWLIDTPSSVEMRQIADQEGIRFQAGHDGYHSTHGLTHMRRLDLSSNGRALSGEDTLVAVSEDSKKRFDTLAGGMAHVGIPYTVRFHLHPDVDAELDMGGTAVSMVLKSGEIWVFRHNTGAELLLEPSVYLERNRLKPRATKQIILSARAMEYASRVSWRLSKAQDTPMSLRDLNRD